MDFLYEPVLQAAGLAPALAHCSPHSSLLVAALGSQARWALTGASCSKKQPSAAQPGASADIAAQVSAGLGTQRAALGAIQLLQTFAGNPQARSFTAAGSTARGGCQPGGTGAGRHAGLAGAVLAAVTRVAAVEQPSLRWSCLHGCASAAQAAGIEVAPAWLALRALQGTSAFRCWRSPHPASAQCGGSCLPRACTQSACRLPRRQHAVVGLLGLMRGDAMQGKGMHGSMLQDGLLYRPKLLKAAVAAPASLLHLTPSPRGSLGTLRARALPQPVPGRGQVLLHVRAVGLNFRDVLNVLGMYPGDPGEPGSDVSGIVAALGPGTAHLHRHAPGAPRSAQRGPVLPRLAPSPPCRLHRVGLSASPPHALPGACKAPGAKSCCATQGGRRGVWAGLRLPGHGRGRARADGGPPAAWPRRD